MGHKRSIADIPELLVEYSEKNTLSPDKVTASTREKLWWKCSKPRCGYEWQATGHDRIIGKGCPACASLVVTEKNNLAVRHPELVQEYSSKNPLPASKVLAGTNKRLWWKCITCDHEWQTKIYSRVSGINCPHCKRKEKTA